MNVLGAVLILAVAAGLFMVLKALQARKQDQLLAFIRQEVLFTPAEHSFLGVLEQAVDSRRYRVFGKVRLADIIRPIKGLPPRARTTAMNRIGRQHVDFVICSAADLAVVGVVELDDLIHIRGEGAVREVCVDQALAMARIPVVRFPTRREYALDHVRDRLAEIISPAGKPPHAPGVQAEPDRAEAAAAEHMRCTPVQAGAAAPTCPNCATEMRKRQAVKGEHAGKWFWACPEFPRCRQVVVVGNG
ncbi:MAG TPA: DUF2726 domain-containing protein [Desulfuromonadaceae bacterium]